jgi:hypothetical protein
MNVRIHQGATMVVKPQNCKRLPVPPRRSLRLPVRDQALQIYIPYIAGLERVQMVVLVTY